MVGEGGGVGESDEEPCLTNDGDEMRPGHRISLLHSLHSSSNREGPVDAWE